MQQNINDILTTIDDAINGFQSDIPGIQKLVWEELQPLIKDIDIKDGRMLNNVKNLRLIGTLQNKLEKIIVNASYKESVKKFIESFGAVSNLNNEYFKQFNQQFKPKNTLPILKKLTVESTINDLVGQGLHAGVIRPVQDILRQNITTGGSYAKFNEQLTNYINGTGVGEGALQRHTRQITTDAINQYNAQYHDAIAQDLQFNWGRYVGSNITTSRDFCLQLTKKQWVHRSELPEILKGHIDGKTLKLSPTTKLPYGMMPGTNVDNFKVYRGGYNCGHQFFWVPDSAVPEDVKRSLNYKNNPPEPVQKTNTGKIDLKNIKKLKSIEDVHQLFKDNTDILAPYFNNTVFKSLSITRKININGSTDMDGNIWLSDYKANHFVDGVNNIKNKIALSEDQEKAFATMWHEIWHNTNKARSTRLTLKSEQYMELGNEFVARKTLDEFFELFGSKLKNTELKNNRTDTGYNRWVKNYDKLIAHFKADENIVLEFMKNKMKTGNYSDVKTYLVDAIIEGVKFSKLKAKDVKEAVQDAINKPDLIFNEKYK